MTILFVLVPASVFLGMVALVGFVWTIRSDQYEDLSGDAMRILDEAED